jgi:hypothetical protein
VKTVEYLIPSYALCYLLYGDTSGMENEDIATVDRWQEKNIPASAHLSVGEDYGFSTRPAFGLPCDCTECEVVTI